MAHRRPSRSRSRQMNPSTTVDVLIGVGAVSLVVIALTASGILGVLNITAGSSKPVLGS
jgi:hypothetical protein